MYKMSTDLIAKIVTELLDDVNFVQDCKELKEIMKDGKFDFNDMPQVVTLVVWYMKNMIICMLKKKMLQMFLNY